MNYYSLTLSENELKIIKEYYNEFIVFSKNQYIYFRAEKNETVIEAYKTGTVVFKGRNFNIELDLIERLLNKQDYEAIGSDEVGTGDVFGPIVVCAMYLSLDDINKLKILNIKDSKKYKDSEIINLAENILNNIKPLHTVSILNNDRYNDFVLNKKFNMNKIKALLHNHVISSVYNKVGKEVEVILDQFCLPQNYFEYLKNENQIFTKINFKTKAETYHISVACASIIARYVFLNRLNDLSKKIGFNLKKGASKEVSDLFYQIKNKYGDKLVNKIAKLNFKNIQ